MSLRNAVAAVLSWSFSLCAQGFILPSGCELPFAGIKTTGLPIDTSCTSDGNAGDNKAKQLESNAKNNFCASGTPIPVTYTTFTKLESASTDDIRKALKTDRSELAKLGTAPNGKRIGEGTVVQFVAFVLDAHASNVGKGELVNCNTRGADSNDIHIELVKAANEDDACNSVAAEMSPHFRPDSWADLPTISVKRPVRVTGPLFFDGSHRPCRGDTRPSPNRISVWEIHPVYQFEVCKNKSLSACKAGDNKAWIPLDRWHSHTEDETDR